MSGSEGGIWVLVGGVSWRKPSPVRGPGDNWGISQQVVDGDGRRELLRAAVRCEAFIARS